MTYEVIDMEAPNVRIVKNFLTQEEIDKVLEVKNWSEDLWDIDYELNYPKLDNVSDERVKWAQSQWKGMCINFTHDNFYDRYPIDKQFYLDIAKRIEDQVSDKFAITSLRKEQYLINRWRPGREQTPHLDYFYEDEAGHDYDMLAMNNLPKDWLHSFGERFQTKHFSSLIYLNEDYVGGELWFPQYNNYSIKPEVGSLIVFKGDENTLHGVRKVESGIRYTISLFWEDLLYKSKMKKADV